MPSVNDPAEGRQALEVMTGDRIQDQLALQNNRCPRCNRFGVISGADDYYGIIYHCSCIHVFWVISPETGEMLEGG